MPPAAIESTFGDGLKSPVSVSPENAIEGDATVPEFAITPAGGAGLAQLKMPDPFVLNTWFELPSLAGKK